MAKQTQNYGFILPEQEDFYNVDDFNSNATKIDNRLYVQEQEIIGVGKKLDVIGQNVRGNGENITGVGQKVDALSRKLGTSQDTTKDTIFGALANQKKSVYIANKTMVQQELKTMFVEESRGLTVYGPVILGHFYAEADGEIYISATMSHNNHVSGSYTTKIFSGLVPEDFRNAPVGTLYRQPEPTPLYTCPQNSSYYGGAVLSVKKGEYYDFVMACSRVDDVRVSFKLCYELKTK